MKSQKYCFVTNLSHDTVSEILLRKHSEVAVKLQKEQIKIRYTARIYRNSWDPVFVGTFNEHSSGTMISGEFQLEAIVRVFMKIWRGFVIFIASVALISVITSGGDISFGELFLGTLFLAAFFLLMYLASYLVEKKCQTIGKAAEREILRFIEKELMAKPYLPNLET